VRRLWASLAMASLMAPALANEALVRRMVQERLGAGGLIESIQKAPFAGFYEVVVRTPEGPYIYYVDSRANYIIAGSVIEARTGRNLTEDRQRKLTAIQWDGLPFQWAITSKRGDGRRKIAVLSDPNCPFCKRFEEDLARLDDITVHIFPYAVIKPESMRQARAVWCSKDRVKAWNDLMFRRIEPPAVANCDAPIEKVVELGRRLGANSTPTWFLQNGERHTGVKPIEELRRLLDAAAAEAGSRSRR
jgi:thiol:disulfide interchange protein DsbC